LATIYCQQRQRCFDEPHKNNAVTMMAALWKSSLLFLLLLASIQRAQCTTIQKDDTSTSDNPYSPLDDVASRYSRSIASTGVRATRPTRENVRKPRAAYPEKDPHICLAFLSCCGRTDLLNHTLAGAIRHMEEDEPSFLRYEIAWVDNGSGSAKTSDITDSYQIEHSLVLKENMGLAYGMNLLINNLCTAPYILCEFPTTRHRPCNFNN
jgi:hypothetical protein